MYRFQHSNSQNEDFNSILLYCLHFTGDRMATDYGYSSVHSMAFSTYDKYTAPSHCGPRYHHDGGWWFMSCSYTYLNGPWKSIYLIWPWHPTVDYMIHVRGTLMMIRPNQESTCQKPGIDDEVLQIIEKRCEKFPFFVKLCCYRHKFTN